MRLSQHKAKQQKISLTHTLQDILETGITDQQLHLCSWWRGPGETQDSEA